MTTLLYKLELPSQARMFGALEPGPLGAVETRFRLIEMRFPSRHDTSAQHDSPRYFLNSVIGTPTSTTLSVHTVLGSVGKLSALQVYWVPCHFWFGLARSDSLETNDLDTTPVTELTTSKMLVLRCTGNQSGALSVGAKCQCREEEEEEEEEKGEEEYKEDDGEGPRGGVEGGGEEGGDERGRE